MLDRLVTVADLAGRAGLAVMPTLFTGHMSGVNLDPAVGARRGGARAIGSGFSPAARSRRRDCATGTRDAEVAAAQALLAGEAAAALAGHDALWAWDLGNENSNCVVPPNRASARQLARSDHLGDPSPPTRTALITIGLHMEDLEEDRKLGPWEAARVVRSPLDARLPDLRRLGRERRPTSSCFRSSPTSRAGSVQGATCVFSEFGVPTYRAGDPAGEAARRASRSPLIEEDAAAAYIERGLDGAPRAPAVPARCSGATPTTSRRIWDVPPLDLAIHERSFGLWRADGSPKPGRRGRRGAHRDRNGSLEPTTPPWIDIEPTEFFVDPGAHLRRLYRFDSGTPASNGTTRPQNGDTGRVPAIRALQTKEINVMEDLPTTLAERVDELISSHQRQEFVSTMGTQAALQELTARVAGLELAVREIAHEVQARVD